MTVMELARTLGESIANGETYRDFTAKKANYEKNSALQGAILEYNAQRAILGEEFRKDADKQDSGLIAAVRARTDELFARITENADYVAFIKAQEKLNQLMGDVNAEISFYAFGERPCTHDCSSCSSGCSGKH